MDIDIDFADRNSVLSLIEHRVAALENGKKHNTGIYVTEIPHNPVTGLCTFDYKTAEERGYFKLDFLNVHIYKHIKDHEHLEELMNREPVWELLEHEEFINQVFHLSGNADVVKKLKPKTIEQLAATLAIIRPSKRYLLSESWETIFEQVWQRPNDGSYYFKKSHAISYAVACVVHINMLCEGAITDGDNTGNHDIQ